MPVNDELKNDIDYDLKKPFSEKCVNHSKKSRKNVFFMVSAQKKNACEQSGFGSVKRL